MVALRDRDSWMRALLKSIERPIIKLVGIRLALYLNLSTGQCNPSHEGIARDLGGYKGHERGCGVSKDSAKRAIKTLEAHGWISIQRAVGRGRTNNFVLLPPPEKGANESTLFDNEKGCNGTPEKGAWEPGKGCNGTDKRVHSSAPRTEKRTESPLTERNSAHSRAAALSRGGGDDWPDDYRERFAATYPHKVSMAKAIKVLDQVKRQGKVTWRVLMEAVVAYAAKQDDAYWANPAKWLAEERWNDKPAEQTKQRTLAERAAERAREMEARERPGDRARRLAKELEALERGEALPDAVGGAELGGDDARVVSTK